MHVGNLSPHQSTHEDVGRIANGSGEGKDLPPLGVTPPAPAYRRTRYGLREVRDWSASSFEHDAVATDECKGSARRHCGVVLPAQPKGPARKPILRR